MRYLPPSATVALDDQQRAAARDLDRSLPTVLVPARRPVTNALALVDGYQDPVDEQVGPLRRIDVRRPVGPLLPEPQAVLGRLALSQQDRLMLVGTDSGNVGSLLYFAAVRIGYGRQS
jgi:hypothetical protein